MSAEQTPSDLPRRPWRRTIANARAFFLNDYGQTLFPLKTNRFLAEHGFERLLEFGLSAAAAESQESQAFLPQRSVSALKAGWHQRRTVKLDPVAEVFVYDFMFRNRNLIRGAISKKRECYGYTFREGIPFSPTLSYRGFKGAKSEYASTYRHSLSFDIASYFNSIYHHDLTEWAEDRRFSAEDVVLFGRFLRETKSGRSIDCLPQGLFPTKMIGNDFLKFIDNSARLSSPQLIRFMDDIVIFGDNRQDIVADFYLIQDLLGQRGLSINSAKTKTSEEEQDVASAVDEVKQGLLRKRRSVISRDYSQGDVEEAGDIHDVVRNLTKKEVARLKAMLNEPHLEEEDAELILTLMGENSADVLGRFDDLLEDFPNLSKSLHSFCRHIVDREALAETILQYISRPAFVPEYQLFWIGMILDDYLLRTKKAGEIIRKLIAHPQSTTITIAKILEIPTSDFGLPEFRIEHLREGKSDWLAWSAAVGSRVAPKGTRNQMLKYYKNASPINAVIADIVSSFDGSVFD
ncbi:RNA-directed DNA polymerase [Mesorhizobium sp. XAP10]|uniref:antiviral reverse transcriptase Drt5 n=1 Tax=unclassified Mesorhizobium TaxID=325217 RepID=UPI0023DFDF93|nr:MULTISPECIES: antiviral reverse transcriptase Drt5 [unclassified Mesorhizobium]MDF3152047.1 RNA-directed DNA polymerase [Mesorhizobium sp. XAP10]MDF3244933.1 RNA-directed DNA polymerase [Mesorhizobium sp. XAP4]